MLCGARCPGDGRSEDHGEGAAGLGRQPQPGLHPVLPQPDSDEGHALRRRPVAPGGNLPSGKVLSPPFPMMYS